MRTFHHVDCNNAEDRNSTMAALQAVPSRLSRRRVGEDLPLSATATRRLSLNLSLILLLFTIYATSGVANGSSATNVQLSGILEFGSAVSRTTPQEFDSLISQLAALAGHINVSRIVAPTIQLSSPGSRTSVLRFTILDGSPSAQSAYNFLRSQVSTSGGVLSITETGSYFNLSPLVIGWTDDGPCPTLNCSSPGGVCNASLSNGFLTCACTPNYQSPQCSIYTGPHPLLGLLVIPIVVAIVLIVLVVWWLVRRQRAARERKRAPEEMPTSTIGGLDPGMRNMVFPDIASKNYAISFNEVAFNSQVEEDVEAKKQGTVKFAA